MTIYKMGNSGEFLPRDSGNFGVVWLATLHNRPLHEHRHHRLQSPLRQHGGPTPDPAHKKPLRQSKHVYAHREATL